MTRVAPAIPAKNRAMENVTAECAKPVKAAAIEAHVNTPAMTCLAQYRSQRDPEVIRIKKVEQIAAVKTT
jgi:hypothetical protein